MDLLPPPPSAPKDVLYKPYRETIKLLQDNTIHALRYFEGCSQYLNLDKQIESLINELREDIQYIITSHTTRLTSFTRSQISPHQQVDDWMREEELLKLKKFLNSNEWPHKPEEQDLAITLLRFESEQMVHEAAKQTISDNQTIIRRLGNGINEVKSQVKAILAHHLKVFPNHTKKHRPVEEDQSQDRSAPFNKNSSSSSSNTAVASTTAKSPP